MSRRVIWVLADGPHELGSEPHRPCSKPEDLAPLARLVHRILGEPKDVEFRGRKFSRLAGRHRFNLPPAPKADQKLVKSKYGKALLLAVYSCFLEGWHGMVVLIDRDGKPDAEKAQLLKEARAALHVNWYRPCAVGQAVESFDAWMIADRQAVNDAEGNSEGLPAKPERQKQPKKIAAKAFECLQSGMGLGECYQRVASLLNTSELEKVCPKGFKPFADDVRTHIGPLFAGGDAAVE